MMTNTMNVTISGIPVDDFYCDRKLINEIQNMANLKRKDVGRLRKLAITLWGVSGAFFAKSYAYAAGTSDLWNGFLPLFRLFQDMAMVLGSIAIFIGLLIVIFKKQTGKKVIITAGVVVGGCFLVPAAIMLVSIIGSMLNDALLEVFQNSNLQDSVKVGK